MIFVVNVLYECAVNLTSQFYYVAIGRALGAFDIKNYAMISDCICSEQLDAKIWMISPQSIVIIKDYDIIYV